MSLPLDFLSESVFNNALDSVIVASLSWWEPVNGNRSCEGEGRERARGTGVGGWTYGSGNGWCKVDASCASDASVNICLVVCYTTSHVGWHMCS